MKPELSELIREIRRRDRKEEGRMQCKTQKFGRHFCKAISPHHKLIHMPIRDVTKYEYVIRIDQIMCSKWIRKQIGIGGTLLASECSHVKLMEEAKSKLHDVFT